MPYTTTDLTAHDGSRLVVTVRSMLERFRRSLLGVPVIWVAGAVILAELVTWIDGRIGTSELPGVFDTTVSSARALLAAITSGTIGAASVVFSLTLIAIQMSTSAYSSRVLRSFLRDRFQQNMIGILLAAFTYSLLVLSEVRGPLDEGGDPYLPRLSVFLAVVLALASVLALLGSINHTAKALRSSSVARELVEELVGLIEEIFEQRDEVDLGPAEQGAEPNSATLSSPGPMLAPSEPGAVLTADRRGFVQQVSFQAIRDRIDDRSTVRLEVSPGDYVSPGRPLMTIWPPPSRHDLDDRTHDLRRAFAIGEERTLQQDVGFGFVLLEDVATKALSPGVNDPNTAIEVIEQLGEPVLAMLERELHADVVELDGCRMIRASTFSYDDAVVAAFNRIRHDARDAPGVQRSILRTLVDVGDELIRRRRATPASLDAVRSMIALVEADLDRHDDNPEVRAARRELAATSWYRSDEHRSESTAPARAPIGELVDTASSDD